VSIGTIEAVLPTPTGGLVKLLLLGSVVLVDVLTATSTSIGVIEASLEALVDMLLDVGVMFVVLDGDESDVISVVGTVLDDGTVVVDSMLLDVMAVGFVDNSDVVEVGRPDICVVAVSVPDGNVVEAMLSDLVVVDCVLSVREGAAGASMLIPS